MRDVECAPCGDSACARDGSPAADPLALTDSLPRVSEMTATLAEQSRAGGAGPSVGRCGSRGGPHADEDAWRAAQADFHPRFTPTGDYGFSGNLPEGSARTGSIRGQLDLPIFSRGFPATVAEIRGKPRAQDGRRGTTIAIRGPDRRGCGISHDTLNGGCRGTAGDGRLRSAGSRARTADGARPLSAGVGDNIQLLSAQTALEEARESQINALAGYHVARVNWAMALGTVSAFHL